jgi:eukaryotic-like serine/threonine-protein kinase
MDAQRWQKIKNLFDRAQKLESGERRRFLEKACAGDEELRREVEKLVASFDDATSFMESPAAAFLKTKRLYPPIRRQEI